VNNIEGRQKLAGGRWFCAFAAVEAIVALIVLAGVPRESGSYSLARVVLLVLLAAVAAIWVYSCFRLPRILTAVPNQTTLYLVAIAAVLLGTALFLLRYFDPERLASYYARLGVVLWYFLILALQACLFLLARRNGLHVSALADSKPFLRPWLVALGILFLAAIFVAVTRTGVTPDPAYWGEPGVPVLGWQLAVALLGGLAIWQLAYLLGARPWLDFAIGAAVWGFAVGLWLSVPLSVMHNSFYAPIDPPAHQAFPNSDAGYYDSMAESLLIGYPYQGDIPSRPLYIVGLTLLHLLVGERYDWIVAGQTLVLALIPVILYALGRSLHSRAAGLIAAMIAIFREFTTLLVSSDTRVSNTKTLLADLPTLLLILLACLLALRWFRRRDMRSALVAGGAFGLLLLLRTQASLILPVLLLLSIPAYGGLRKPWLQGVATFLGGFLLSIAPWLMHNYLATGHLAFDAPFQYQIIASQYRYTGNLDIKSIDLQGKSLLGILWAFAVRDPGFVLGFVANHSLATQVGGLLALPLIETYNGLFAPINLYWLSWDGVLSWFNLLLIGGYLIIIAIGLGAAWRRFRWAGLTPLAFSLGYSLANGLARFSGWRYDLPADWIWYFFFAIGIAEILGILGAIFGASPPPQTSDREGVAGLPSRQVPMWIPLAGLLIVGASPWLLQSLAKPRYDPMTASTVTQTLVSAQRVQALGIDAAELQRFGDSTGSVVQVGRALYPRFFSKGGGLASAHPWPAYAPRDYPRLGFLLLNQTRHDVVLPTREQPTELNQASDVIVLGCQQADYIEARLVLVVDSGVTYLARSLADRCP
jgi:Dolichyl-phosphate-mannose-protein mannosyltransferase